MQGVLGNGVEKRGREMIDKLKELREYVEKMLPTNSNPANAMAKMSYDYYQFVLVTHLNGILKQIDEIIKESEVSE